MISVSLNKTFDLAICTRNFIETHESAKVITC